jgi:dipeptidyl-peptidase-3
MQIRTLFYLAGIFFLASCGGESADQNNNQSGDADSTATTEFQWQTEQFADLKMIRYQIPGWDRLSGQQQELAYYLTQAGLCGRDMMYDQNYRHNLTIRRALENIYTTYDGEKSGDNWSAFETYLKRVWFSNGIHHHYSNAKFDPGFDQAYFDELCAATGTEVSDEVKTAMFDPTVDAKKVEKNAEKGLVEGSAVNFYGPDVTTDEAKAYMASIKVEGDRAAISYSLNSRLVKNENGEIEEQVYKVGGLYGEALKEVVSWLRKAEGVAENEKQAAALRNLAKYYESGDLKTWDLYNINWVQDTEGDIDYINGFVEVYNDPLGFTGSYETIVEIKDFDASERMAALMDDAQWFEDQSPIMEEHKKDTVKGILYNVVNVVGEAGDASPSSPIGVNLPNANWIRVKHGSKSVSLGNIVGAYANSSGSSLLEEFAHDEEEIRMSKEHGDLAGKLHTAMHEVIGHASGEIEDGVGTPSETLENFRSTIEEGRADLVALYYLMDNKLVDMGLMPSLEVGMAEYDSYIRNGMMMQLRRLEVGDEIEEAHMRNRAWVAHWAFEQAEADSIIVKVERDGKTFFDIRNYEDLRDIFGQLLREVQRIKSQGDFEAAKALVEGYGVTPDPAIHQQVVDRCEPYGIAPYGGFINPMLVAETDADGNVTGVTVEYPDDFAKQMLYYSEKYSFLP